MEREAPLLPCPFCGGEAEPHMAEREADDAHICCPSCEIRITVKSYGMWFYTNPAAVAAWNTRAWPLIRPTISTTKHTQGEG